MIFLKFGVWGVNFVFDNFEALWTCYRSASLSFFLTNWAKVTGGGAWTAVFSR